MSTKEELEERLVSLTKELDILITDFNMRFRALADERSIVKIKLEGKHYEEK